MHEYHGLRIEVTPRQLLDGGLCYDTYVYDGFYRPLWAYLASTPEGGLSAARRWIDGTDRSVGFTHTH